MHLRAFSLAILASVCACVGAVAGESAGFPFEFNHGLIWVKVASGGSTLNFILDSGAGSNVINQQTAQRLGLKAGAAMKVQTVGSLANAYRVHDFKGAVGTIPVSPEMVAIDLQGASAICCRRIDGLLGQDFFKGRVVQIDFRSRRVRLLAQAELTNASAVLPLRYHNDALCVPVGINGLRPQWTRLDTGCDSSLEWSNEAGIAKRKGGTLGLTSGSGKTIIADVQLGTERVSGVKTGLHNRPIFAGEAGLLGSGLLSKYCITIDTRHMKLILSRS